jgi:hypothetical protein
MARVLSGRPGTGQAGSLGQRRDTLDHQGIGSGQNIRHFRIVQPRRHLLLPEIEIAARELVGIGRIGHGPDYNGSGA